MCNFSASKYPNPVFHQSNCSLTSYPAFLGYHNFSHYLTAVNMDYIKSLMRWVLSVLSLALTVQKRCAPLKFLKVSFPMFPPGDCNAQYSCLNHCATIAPISQMVYNWIISKIHIVAGRGCASETSVIHSHFILTFA